MRPYFSDHPFNFSAIPFRFFFYSSKQLVEQFSAEVSITATSFQEVPENITIAITVCNSVHLDPEKMMSFDGSDPATGVLREI